jgi:hypothetical protein
MSIIQEVRSMGLNYDVRRDGEVVVGVPQLPDYYAYLSEFPGGVWCEISEAYTGTTVKVGVLPTVVQAINFAQFHSFLFENELLRSMTESCEWPRGAA